MRMSHVFAAVGCGMFIAAIWLLFWNERKAVQITCSMEEAMRNVVRLSSPYSLSKENDDKLVYLSGVLEVGEPLIEIEYGIAVSAVKLKRRVQMYQWVEERNLSLYSVQEDNTKYSYDAQWMDKLVPSSSFYIKSGHHNPMAFPLRSVIFVNEHVNVGKFFLDFPLKNKFNDYVAFTSDERPERRDIKLHDGLYYHTYDVWNPEIGDIRIQFSYSGKAGEYVTIVAKQVGSLLTPFELFGGDYIGLVRYGQLTLDEMFQDKHAYNWRMLWFIRGFGWLLTFLGINCIMDFRSSIVSRLLSSIMIMDSDITNFSVSFSVLLLVIACAWLSYCPIFGLTVLTMALMPFLYSCYKYCIRENSKHKQSVKD